MIGNTVSHYKIISKVGEGGMGEVYRATDTRLNRDVALKVLPQVFAQDKQRMARFEREAQVLASLNHPNIAAIYGLEEDAGTKALAMELVEGEDLSERIARGPILLDEALRLALQIAEALEDAHEKGIIHRDLKPANIKLTAEGKVKVLDFGLAKALEEERNTEEISNSPTLTLQATQAGIILGTAAYMSPEQARGKSVDRRTDIWAIGLILYEMLCRRRVFSGDTIADVLAGVLERDPDWELLPSDVPVPIRKLLRRCLTKEKRRRLGSVSEIIFSLEEYLTSPSEATLPPGFEESPGVRSRGLPFLKLAAFAIICAVSAIVGWQWISLDEAPKPIRLVLPMETERVRTAQGTMAISPDGSAVVYVSSKEGKNRLELRRMDRSEATSLDGTEEASNPFFSPDGTWVGFFSGETLKKVSITGGAPLTVCQIPNALRTDFTNRGATWSSQGTIVFSPTFRSDEGLYKVPSSGGKPERFTKPNPEEGEGSHRWPHFLPGGEYLLATIEKRGALSFNEASIALVSLSSGERRILIEGGTEAQYIPSGHIVYVREGSLLAAPFDLKSMEVTGPSVPVLEGLAWSSSTGTGHFKVSDEGTLAYIRGEDGLRSSILEFDREGNSTRILKEDRPFTGLSLSPDGRYIAASIATADESIWIFDFKRANWTRFTFETGDDASPSWTPDGKRLTYVSTRAGQHNLYWRSLDGSSPEERLLKSENAQFKASWAPDGRTLAFTEAQPDTQMDIQILDLEGKVTPFLRTPFDELNPQFSPDGKWIAYMSNEGTGEEIYVRPFPGPGSKWQISNGGGMNPVWSSTGKELFFLTQSAELMTVQIETSPSFAASAPQKLFAVDGLALSWLTWRSAQSFDVMPGGESFVFVVPSNNPTRTQIQIVLNWFGELERITAAQ